MSIKFKLGILFFSFIFQSICQNHKGLYIDKFHQILGNQEREDSLFEYIDYHNFNSITLYNLHNLDFTSIQQMNDLQRFISDARILYNVTEITAVAENAWFFENKIIPYNQNSNFNEQFNVFNLEFEFWVPSAVSGYYCTTYLQSASLTCDESGAFQFYMQELEAIKSIASQYDIMTEVYLGWFNQNQADQIKLYADRVLLSNYQLNPQNCFDVSLQRLEYLGNSSPTIKVAGLFSSENDFLGPWLNTNDDDLDSVYSIYSSEYNLLNGTWKSNINLIGQQWFTYSTMNNEVPTLGNKDINQNYLTIFPNPTSGYLHLNMNVEKINIFDSNWKQLNFNALYFDDNTQNIIDLNQLIRGVYFIEVNNKYYKIVKI